ncbi:MAG: hypothetical protein H6981_08965 [Gammaproteobacteria bacterium]|nr:hypothetical protein [Gammaproteobacteria bacterium]MCP5136919.1 hypothetical protein [Gammaproteobacteria bacterium]
MRNRCGFRFLVFGGLVASLTLFMAPASASVIVGFSGKVVPLTVPASLQPYFAGNDTFTGSYVLDTTVIATGVGGVKTFTNVVRDFQVSFQNTLGQSYTGDGGRVQQYANAGGTTEFFAMKLGNGQGTVAGDDAGAFALRDINFDLRGADLFLTETELNRSLAYADLGYARVTFAFTDGASVGYVIAGLDAYSTSESVVPVPFALMLMLVPGAVLIRRHVHCVV